MALHRLKYQYNLSDEAVVARRVENPYWQHFSGHQFYEHELPIDPGTDLLVYHRLRMTDDGTAPLFFTLLLVVIPLGQLLTKFLRLTENISALPIFNS